MVSEDMVLSAVHRFDRDCQAHWPLELPLNQLAVAVDCMAVAVTFAGFVVVAADMRSAMHRYSFDPVAEYYCGKKKETENKLAHSMSNDRINFRCNFSDRKKAIEM